jgi:tRNA(fMet)-specific endonuclease VapC
VGGVVVDTSLLVAAERRRFDMEGYLAGNSDVDFAIAAITASELFHGFERATTNAIRLRRSRFIEQVLRLFVVLPFGLTEAREHARVWAALERQGTPVGPHDLLIAASALSAGFSVATFNRREFERVPGLAVAEVESFRRP